MTTEQYFNCIFCKETFDNKEELQIHFRKHGDPKFNQNMRNKSRPQSESPNTSDKSTEDNELVGCDVCEEVFPTISKAITHKHKMHPDHDAKYFCPFCGKLFTMKHLYNKHIQANHDSQKAIERSDFQCESCDVLFYLPSAMMYHNKFFHRQDTELPSIGQSKKVKLYFQELLQIYYCSFCGEEFNNKVNLHKHIGDDHSDENQSPDDVLKCPLCEALFYHLDAYEVHLMFHSPDDIYSEKNQMVDEVTEFSLETVPPIVEKIEDDETPHNSTELDDFLQLVMGGDSVANDELGKVKLKKHKKHKKSKKAAITLDEFLNMNKDVFGDGIDVHGIEEVPTQVVLNKKYKGRKPTNLKSKAINADIDKLKKQGIVVKSKKKTVASKSKKVFENNETIGSPKEEIQSKSISTPDDVLSKLLRQSSSQIKIVKKSVPQNESKQLEEQTSEIAKVETNGQNKTNMDDKPSDINCKSVDDKLGQSDEEDDMDDSNEMSGTCDEGEFNNSFENSDNPQDMAELEITKDKILPFRNEKENKIDNKEVSEDVPKSDMSNEDVNNESKENNDTENNSTETISALKRLSHLITVKPVKHNQPVNLTTQKESDYKIKEECNDNSGDSSYEEDHENKLLDSVFKAPEVLPKKNCQQNIKKAIINTATIKKSGNNVSVKTGALVNKEPGLESKDEENLKPDTKLQNSEDDDKVPQKISDLNSGLLSRLTNVTAKSIPSKPTVLSALPVGTKVNVSPTINRKGVIDENIEIFNIDDSDSEDAGDESSNKTTKCDSLNNEGKIQNTNVKNVIPNLNKNLTIKPCQQKPTIPETNKLTKEKNQLNTCKDSNYTKIKMHSSEIQKSVHLQNTLKNLSSNITVKTKNSSFTPNKEQDSHEESDYYDSDEELDEGKVKITEVTEDVNDTEYDSNEESNAFVQSPDENAESDSNINDDHENNEDEYDDIESQIKSTTVKKSSQPKSPYLDNFKNCSNELTIKPLNEKVNSAEVLAKSPNIKETYNRQKTINKNTQPTQNNEICTVNQNILNKKTSSATNEINTVKTVKKFQTQTVIQEVTTVTRTIRTVNESTNEVVQNTQAPKISPNTIKNPPIKEYYGKVIRHASPAVGTRVMNIGNIATVRPSNQMVPMRPSAPTIRAICPATKQIRKPTPMGNTQKPIIGKLKISPNIINQTKSPQKRPANVIPNNNLKKPKVSNALAEMSSFNNDASMEYTSASTSQSNFTSTTKVVQGKSTVTTSQARSEVTNMQQQLNKLSGMSGLKVMKTSTKQAMHVEEKSECVAPKSHTLEAIEKLQKIGLLVKKPQTDLNNDHGFSESEDEHYDE